MFIEEWIPTLNIPLLQEKVNKINRKAARHGFEGGIELEFLEEETRKLPVLVPVLDENGKEHQHFDTLPRAATKVRISTEIVRIAGWQPQAIFDFSMGDEAIIREIPEANIPKKYYDTDNMCDHCGYRRNRHTTYLLEKDGQYKRVGKTCLRDYLGYNPQMLIYQVDWLNEVLDFVGKASGWYYGDGKKFYCELEYFLPIVSAIIRHIGWISNSKAYEEQRVSTSYWARTWILRPEVYIKENDGGITITDEDREIASKAVEEAKAIDQEEALTNSYLHNLRTLANYGVMGFRDMGYVASMINWYNRLMERRATTEHIGNFVGKVGERIETEAVVKHVQGIDAYYGRTMLHIMETDDENTLVWFTTSTELEEGVKYAVKARVKAHKEYKDKKQTILTRAKCLAIERVYEPE